MLLPAPRAHAATLSACPRTSSDAAASGVTAGSGESHAERSDELDPELDLELELPRLEDDGDEAEDEAEVELDEPTSVEEGADPFDDAEAGDLMGTEHELDPVPQDGEGEDDDAETNLGSLEDELAFLDDEVLASDDAVEDDEEDDELSHAEALDEDDGGAEGFGEDPGLEVDDERLPELDGDDDDEELGEPAEAEAEAESERELPPLAASPWDEVEDAGGKVACDSLAVGAGRVVAGGEALLLVDAGAHAARVSRLEAFPRAVAVLGEATAAATRRGIHLDRGDGFVLAAPAPWREGAALESLVAAAGRWWALSGGALWAFADAGAPLLAREAVRAVAASGGVIVALVEGSAGVALERRRGDDEGFTATDLEGRVARAAGASDVRLASALGSRNLSLSGAGLLCVSRDGGSSFTVTELPHVTAMAFAGEAPDAPLLAFVTPPLDESGHLVELRPGAEPLRVAELDLGLALPADDGSLPRCAVAWDASREIVWIASRAGLTALAPSRRH